MTNGFEIKKTESKDTDWIKDIFIQYWHGDLIVSKGKIQRIDQFTGGYKAEIDSEKIGLITYTITNKELEITGLFSFKERIGVGKTLVNTVIELAKKKELERIFLVTTNDNLYAFGFWQKRGFKIIRVYPNAMEYTRQLKPSIPIIGENGIPLRDEIELEMLL